MSKNAQEWILVALLILITVCAFAAAQQRDELKQQAVDRGFAEWRIIKGSKETEFKWKGEQ
jgi:hypothetical protein